LPFSISLSLFHFFSLSLQKRITWNIMLIQVLNVDWIELMMFRHAVDMSCGNGMNQVGGMNTQPKLIQTSKVPHTHQIVRSIKWTNDIMIHCWEGDHWTWFVFIWWM
jgi:hypothetical protein